MTLTKDEAELYDRQIRLWGVNAQTKLRNSKVIMLGFNGVASEVAKILVLAGIDALTIIDNEPLQDSDLTSNLFCREKSPNSAFRTHAVSDKLKVLNPLVQVTIINETISPDKIGTDLKNYDLLSLHTFLPNEDIISLNQKCRSHQVKFYITIEYGLFGFMFNDLGDKFEFTHEEFESAVENTKQNLAAHQQKKSDEINISSDGDDDDDDDHSEEEGQPRKRQRVRSPARNSQSDTKHHKLECLRYCSFEKMLFPKEASFDRQTSPVLIISIGMFRFFNQFGHLPDGSPGELDEFEKILTPLIETTNVRDNFKRFDPSWRENIRSSLSPVCAVMGGIAGQDMIRALSQMDIPIYNTFSFDGIQMSGVVEKVGFTGDAGDDETKLAFKTTQPVVRDCVQIDDDD